MHSYSKDCRKYGETVKHCFNGVKDLIYSLPSKDGPDSDTLEINRASQAGAGTAPPGLQKSLTLLEFDINAHKLEVKGIKGSNGEEFLFFRSLVSYELQKCPEWFDNLAKIIKSSMFDHVQTYMGRLEQYGRYFWYLQGRLVVSNIDGFKMKEVTEYFCKTLEIKG